MELEIAKVHFSPQFLEGLYLRMAHFCFSTREQVLELVLCVYVQHSEEFSDRW